MRQIRQQFDRIAQVDVGVGQPREHMQPRTVDALRPGGHVHRRCGADRRDDTAAERDRLGVQQPIRVHGDDGGTHDGQDAVGARTRGASAQAQTGDEDDQPQREQPHTRMPAYIRRVRSV
jgi:hypothetical protein